VGDLVNCMTSDRGLYSPVFELKFGVARYGEIRTGYSGHFMFCAYFNAESLECASGGYDRNSYMSSFGVTPRTWY
jgi:hypothetical protein